MKHGNGLIFYQFVLFTLNAVPEKVDWYKKMGFKEMGKNIDAVNTYMYIDLIKDSQYVKNYFEQQTADLLGYWKENIMRNTVMTGPIILSKEDSSRLRQNILHPTVEYLQRTRALFWRNSFQYDYPQRRF